MDQMAQPSARIVFVTGPSGAGRSSAINVLEDLGFESIDNIPLSLIPRLVDPNNPMMRPLALGVDFRSRDFSAEGLFQLCDQLAETMRVDVLYLDCSNEVLVRRYSETRRRHPLAPDGTAQDGVLREQDLLADVRSRADVLIDTSELTVHDLRAEVETKFAEVTQQGMAVSVQSFSYKRGLPQGLDVVIDCRFLRNPHWDPELRASTGMDQEVGDFVSADPRYEEFLDRSTGLILLMLPACKAEGKAHFAIGFGCTGGQHRSVAITEKVASALAQTGWRVSIRHRELERRGATPVFNRQSDLNGEKPR